MGEFAKYKSCLCAIEKHYRWGNWQSTEVFRVQLKTTADEEIGKVLKFSVNLFSHQTTKTSVLY